MRPCFFDKGRKYFCKSREEQKMKNFYNEVWDYTTIITLYELISSSLLNVLQNKNVSQNVSQRKWLKIRLF